MTHGRGDDAKQVTDPDERVGEIKGVTLRDFFTAAFRGRAPWLGGLFYLGMLVWVAVLVVAIVGFFRVGEKDVRGMVGWAALAVFAAMAVGMLKLWMWLMASHLVLERDLRRLEQRQAPSQAGT
jgi:hypothetical protein